MQPGVPNKPMPPQYQAPYAGGTSGGRGCGCFGLGCGALLLAMIALCGVGYYSIFYSNLPLALMKQALEESGNVKIDGLKGNLSTGFEMAALRFKDDGLRGQDGERAPWSELTDIKIKYRNGGMFSNSFTVEEIRIGGGTIYGDLNFSSELGGDLVFEELQEEFSDFQSEFSGDSRGTLGVRSISFTNLKISDPKTGEEFRIDEIRLDDVVIENGRLVEFGDLVIKADSIELETVRSNTFENAELERTFKGRLEKGLIANLLSDIPFEIELGVFPDGKLATRSRFFEGQVEFDAGLPGQPNRYRLNGFSPANHLKLGEPGVVPAEIHLDVTYDRERKSIIAEVDPEGSLLFGQTKLGQFRLTEEKEVKSSRQHILATGEVAGQTVAAEVYPLKRFPLVGIRLRKAADWTLEETWARTVFGKPYGELDDADRALIQTGMSMGERLARPRDDQGSSRDRRRSGNRNRQRPAEAEDSWESEDAPLDPAGNKDEATDGWGGDAEADAPAPKAPAETAPAGGGGG